MLSSTARERELLKENERLEKELDKVYQRPPWWNPIYVACLKGADETPERIGIKNIEMADYKNRPAYIFTVTEMNRDVSKVIALLEYEGFEFVRLEDEDLARPFPQDQSEGLTVCVGIPDGGPGDSYFHNGPLKGDCGALHVWENLYTLSGVIAYKCFPKWRERLTVETDAKPKRELVRLRF